MMGGSYRPTRTSIRTLAGPIASRYVGVAYPSVVDLGEQPEQLASQLATIVVGEPGGASSFEHLGDRIRRRNYV